MKTCVKCGETKPLESFAIRNKKTGSHIARCRTCIAEDNRRPRPYRPPVPAHLQHLIRKNGRSMCVPGDVVRDVLAMIDPELTPAEIAQAINCDWSRAKLLAAAQWVSEERVDAILTAFHCNHLWWAYEPLNRSRLALVEYEELLVECRERMAVAG